MPVPAGGGSCPQAEEERAFKRALVLSSSPPFPPHFNVGPWWARAVGCVRGGHAPLAACDLDCVQEVPFISQALALPTGPKQH